MQLHHFDTNTFLQDYWQKKPLVIRSAFSDPYFIEADDLAGLACEEGIESRIIQQHNQQWQVKHGPFDESLFSQLPEQDWTLLVQAVDHWMPEVADILTAFSFLPQWRLDDIMVSYAPTGGTVAPHYDFYDVFLIQGEGQRRWQVGQVCDSTSALIPDTPVKILTEFEPLLDVVLEPGDMLYVPAKHAHYGVSIQNSLTYSVGFRAPSVRDMMDGVASKALEYLTEDIRYQDCVNSLSASRGEIPPVAIEQVQQLLQTVLQDKALLSEWLAEFVTEPKYSDIVVYESEIESWAEVLNHASHLSKHPAARFAYIDLGNQQAHLYVNGIAYPLSKQAAQLIAEKRLLTIDDVRDLSEAPACEVLLKDLFQQGLLLAE